MNKADRKAANRTLAAALRAQGLTPNGQVWEDARDLVAQDLSPQAAARLVRSTLPSHEQVKAIARSRKEATAPKVVAKPVTTPVIERAPVAQAPKRTPERAKQVKAGKVMRDAKGRLMSREAQAEVEGALALLAEINA